MAPPPLDDLIITAANEAQAQGYRLQLDSRRRRGQIPAATRARVVADSGGRRVGSGGSTFVALKALLAAADRQATVAESFAGRRAFILHAGGDSKRLPAYAAQGKLFIPLPCLTDGGHPATLFDLLLENLRRIPSPPRGHVLVAAGDVLLTFDPAAIDFNRPGVIGVAYPDSAERASRHGVYVADRAGRVVDFLQKPNAAALRGHEAIDTKGRALIDTGLLSINPAAIEVFGLAAGLTVMDGQVVQVPGLLADVESGAAGEIDVYQEIAWALAERVTPEAYAERVRSLPRNSDPAQQERRQNLYQAVHGLDFHVQVLSSCDFFHVGSSRELLAGLAGQTRTGTTYHFQNLSRAVAPPGFSADRTFAFNSVIETGQLNCGEGTLLEGCHIRCPLELAGRNILTNLPGEVAQPVCLPEGVGLVMLPVESDKWAAVLYGVEDDFRIASGQGGCTFLNRPIGAFLERHALPAAALWPDGPQTLYHAQLWCLGTAAEVLAQVLWMVGDTDQPHAVSAWRARRRASLADLVQRVNHERLTAHHAELERRWAIHRPFQRLAAEPDLNAAQLAAHVGSLAELAEALEDLARGVAQNCDPGLRPRALVLAMLLCRRGEALPPDRNADPRIKAAAQALTQGTPTPAALGQAASAAVAQALARHVPLPECPPAAAVAHDQVVWASAPARLDFAGGWSDTPPICTDRGGAVVNAAVTLNGQYPVQAIAKLNDQYTIQLASIDLGRRMTCDRVEQLLDYTDPGQWSSLPKACLYLAGFTGGRTSGTLTDILRPFGGGIDLTIFSALPKGSGLGTSSILGATVLGCLAKLSGLMLAPDQLIQRTSLLEQLMTTGGGWQDQVGGVLPGVKLIRTQPGPDQTPAVVRLAFDHEFSGRLLLYYTGMRRLAKNILQNVVHRYLARDPEVLDAVEQLKEGALEVRQAIEARDWDAFGNGVRHYWELKKRIDPGSTTPQVERLIDRIRPDCIGYGLLGAGGGGFLLLVARDDASAAQVRRQLTAEPGSPGARFFDGAIDGQGLRVCVL